jgi:hypothetical protein
MTKQANAANWVVMVFKGCVSPQCAKHLVSDTQLTASKHISAPWVTVARALWQRWAAAAEPCTRQCSEQQPLGTAVEWLSLFVPSAHAEVRLPSALRSMGQGLHALEEGLHGVHRQLRRNEHPKTKEGCKKFSGKQAARSTAFAPCHKWCRCCGGVVLACTLWAESIFTATQNWE